MSELNVEMPSVVERKAQKHRDTEAKAITEVKFHLKKCGKSKGNTFVILCVGNQIESIELIEPTKEPRD